MHLPNYRVWAFGLLCCFCFSGCYFASGMHRPVTGVWYASPHAAEHAQCLFVLLPGFLDTADTYRERGFPERIRARTGCDSVAVNLHFRYYGDADTSEVLYQDVIFPARQRGYQKVWLMGLSMGGLGASMAFARHAEAIDGIVLLAPYVGDEKVVQEIRDAGGLMRWRAPAEERWTSTNYSAQLWLHWQGVLRAEHRRVILYIGWGESDRLRSGAELLSAELPEGNSVTMEGGHSWEVWTPLFDRILDSIASEHALD